ncbi:uncharacterized protein [Branchiostoma lanceolatum]|uniref:uncharacterized protein n=1 Tax=Branchiostoma lanceolatum TaxID=7740 RepID=UPI00345516DD
MRHKRKPPQDVRRRRSVLLSSTKSSYNEDGQGDRSGDVDSNDVGTPESNSAASKAFVVGVFCISLLGTIICMCLLPKYFAADLKTQTRSFSYDFRRVDDENTGEDIPPRTTKLFQARWEFEKGKAARELGKPQTTKAQDNHGDDGDVDQHNHVQISRSVLAAVPLAGGWRRSVETHHKLSEESNCDFDVRYANNLTKAEFEEKYQNREPLLLKFSGGAEDWTDTETWTRAGLVGKYGDHMAQYGYEDTINSNGGMGEEMIALKDYVHAHMDMVNASSVDMAYVVDSKLPSYAELQDKIYPPEYLQYFQKPAGLLFLGRSGLGLGWHEHGDAWNGVVFGEKHWYVYNRSVVPPGLHWYQPADWAKYVYKLLPYHKRPLECVQEAGDIVYIPQGFYHSAINMGETIAVSFREDQITPLPGRTQFMEAVEELASEEAIRQGAHALRVNNVHSHGNAIPDYAVGMFHMREGNFEAAAENFRAAIAVDPFQHLGYLGAADALSQLGRIAEAQKYIFEALERHRSSAQLYAEFGNFKQRQGDLVTALRAFDAGLKLRPDRKDLYWKALALQMDLIENLE